MNPQYLQQLSVLAGIMKSAKTVDLTALLENGIPRWPSHPHLVIDRTVTHEHDGYYCQSVSMPEHVGTHVDAPYHVHPDLPDRTIDRVPADALIGPCTVVDLSAREWSPGESATLADIREALDRTETDVTDGDILLINYGWMQRYWTTSGGWKFYALNQPGLTADVADFVIERGVRAVGTDTIAVGTAVKDGVSAPCHFHERVLRRDIYLMESLVRLDELPAKCFFTAAPLKIAGGSGSPIRAVAFVPQP